MSDADLVAERRVRVVPLVLGIAVVLALLAAAAVYRPVPATIPVPSEPRLGLAASLDRFVYSAGDVADVSVILTNLGARRVVLHFPIPCMVEFLVSNETLGTVYDSTAHWGCVQMLWDLTLVPNGSYTWAFPWNLSDDAGVPLPAPRSYSVTPRFLGGAPPWQDYVVRTEPATFFLGP